MNTMGMGCHRYIFEVSMQRSCGKKEGLHNFYAMKILEKTGRFGVDEVLHILRDSIKLTKDMLNNTLSFCAR